jgi:hypothetical protein
MGRFDIDYYFVLLVVWVGGMSGEFSGDRGNNRDWDFLYWASDDVVCKPRIATHELGSKLIYGVLGLVGSCERSISDM